MPTYEQKVKEQIKQFRDVENLEELPDIFHYWSNKYMALYYSQLENS